MNYRIEIITAEHGAMTDLISASDAYHSALYPPEANELLDAAALAREATVIFGAFSLERLIGMVALRRLDCSAAEIKRLWVTPAARGAGIGRALTLALEQWAGQAGIERLYLETGRLQPEAIGLYSALGFGRTAPFGHYRANQWSVFMCKQLNPDDR